MRLQLYNKETLKKGLGSQLLNYFEYFAFTNGVKNVTGTLAQKDENGKYHTLDEELIPRDALESFYQKYGYQIYFDNKKDEYAFKKELNPKQIKEFSKRQLSAKIGNTNYKIILQKTITKKSFNSITIEK